jgi:hypothetical protein
MIKKKKVNRKATLRNTRANQSRIAKLEKRVDTLERLIRDE